MIPDAIFTKAILKTRYPAHLRTAETIPLHSKASLACRPGFVAHAELSMGKDTMVSLFPMNGQGQHAIVVREMSANEGCSFAILGPHQKDGTSWYLKDGQTIFYDSTSLKMVPAIANRPWSDDSPFTLALIRNGMTLTFMALPRESGEEDKDGFHIVSSNAYSEEKELELFKGWKETLANVLFNRKKWSNPFKVYEKVTHPVLREITITNLHEMRILFNIDGTPTKTVTDAKVVNHKYYIVRIFWAADDVQTGKFKSHMLYDLCPEINGPMPKQTEDRMLALLNSVGIEKPAKEIYPNI